MLIAPPGDIAYAIEIGCSSCDWIKLAHQLGEFHSQFKDLFKRVKINIGNESAHTVTAFQQTLGFKTRQHAAEWRARDAELTGEFLFTEPR